MSLRHTWLSLAAAVLLLAAVSGCSTCGHCRSGTTASYPCCGTAVPETAGAAPVTVAPASPGCPSCGR
jgi:hypothetical protein